jgi:hypothetical protein
MTSYELDSRVYITYRNFDLRTDEFLGWVSELGTVTRVWANGKTISIRTDSGKLFVRNVDSENISRQASITCKQCQKSVTLPISQHTCGNES